MSRTLSSFVFPWPSRPCSAHRWWAAADSRRPRPPAPQALRHDRAGFDAPAAPGKPLAPRLQNLGVHTFPCQHESRARAALHQPGPEPGLRLQPRGSRARVRRSRPARPRPRDGVLGTGARARTEHQRGDERGRRAEGASPRPESGVAEGHGHAARARLHRRARRPLHRQGRATARRPIAPMPTAMRRVAQSFPDDLDAQTLYAEALMDLRPWNYWTRDGKPYRRDDGSCRRRSSRCWRSTRTIRVRCICGFTCGRRPTRRSAPKRKRIACCR